MQNRIVPCRFHQRQNAPEDGIEERRGVLDVQIERTKQAVEMQLGLIVERTADIGRYAVVDAPVDDVAEGDEVEMQVECDTVVEAEIVVREDAVVHERDGERDDSSSVSP